MATVQISERPDLSPVFGGLSEETAAQIHEQLEAADARLAGIVEPLNEEGGVGFATEGVVLETEISGQAMIKVLVEDQKGTVGFGAELRPRNFFGDGDHPWQPGRSPMVMATDGWDVEGSVSVRFKTRVAGRPFTIQEQVHELEERRYETPESAAEAFAGTCEKLAELARSREPTLAGWKPDIPASVGGPPSVL